MVTCSGGRGVVQGTGVRSSKACQNSSAETEGRGAAIVVAVSGGYWWFAGGWHAPRPKVDTTPIIVTIELPEPIIPKAFLDAARETQNLKRIEPEDDAPQERKNGNNDSDTQEKTIHD